MNLIPEWRSAWKLTSWQIAVTIAVINALALGWTAFNGYIDPIVWGTVNMFLGIAVAIARLVPQSASNSQFSDSVADQPIDEEMPRHD